MYIVIAGSMKSWSVVIFTLYCCIQSSMEIHRWQRLKEKTAQDRHCQVLFKQILFIAETIYDKYVYNNAKNEKEPLRVLANV